MFDAGAIVGNMELSLHGWTAAVAKVKSDSTSIQGFVLRNEQAVRRLGIAFGVAGAAMTAASGLVVKAGADEETVYSRLEQQLKNVGYGYEGAVEQVRDFANAMQDVTTYGDEQIALLVTQILPYVNDMNKAFEGTKIALDMASAGLFDLNTASKYVGMAMAGNIEMLGRYIPELRSSNNATMDSMTISEKAAYAMDLLRDKYGGMAQKEAKTLNGAMARLKNSLGDISEAITRNLIPAITPIIEKIRDVVVHIIEWVDQHSKLAAGIFIVFSALGVLATGLGALLFVLPNIVAGWAILSAALPAIVPALLPIAAAALGVYLAFRYWDNLRAMFWSFAAGVNYALSEAVKSIAKFISWGEKIPIIGKKFKAAADTLRDVSNAFKESADLSERKAAEILENIDRKRNALTEGVTATVDTLHNKINESSGAFSGFFSKFSSGFKMSLDKAVTDLRDWSAAGTQAASDMVSGMTTVTGDFFYDVLKGQIKTASEYFAAFGEYVLKILAEMMARIAVVKALTGITGLFSGGTTSAGTSNIASSSFNMESLGFATGIDYIPETGWYKAHEGEKLVPKYDATKETGGNITIENYVTADAVNAAIASKPNTVINIIGADTARNGVTRKTYKRYS